MSNDKAQLANQIVSTIVSDNDLELVINRVFGLMNVPRSEVCLVVKDLAEGLQGYWIEPGLTETNGNHKLESHSAELPTICVSKHIVHDTDQFVRTLAHEIQHHTQWRDGRLVEFYEIANRKVRRAWDGVVHLSPSNFLAYQKLPWEIDARQAEETILDEYQAAYVLTDVVAA